MEQIITDTKAEIVVILIIMATIVQTGINKNQIVSIKGARDGVFSSLGSIYSDIFIGGGVIVHKFYIVDNNFPIPSDGIIGLDFLKTKNCILKYSEENSVLVIRARELPNNVEIPIEKHRLSQSLHVARLFEKFMI